MQVLLTLLAAVFAAAVIYVRETADIPASANGAVYESNVTLGDLARRFAGTGREGNANGR